MDRREVDQESQKDQDSESSVTSQDRYLVINDQIFIMIRTTGNISGKGFRASVPASVSQNAFSYSLASAAWSCKTKFSDESPQSAGSGAEGRGILGKRRAGVLKTPALPVVGYRSARPSPARSLM